MCLSFPGKTARTLPSSHCPRGVSGATTKSTSLTWTSFCSFRHLDLRFKVGSHSHSHRCQKCRTSSCTRLHRFLGLNWPLSPDPGANWPPTSPIRKWFGVMGVSSERLADWYVKGLEFMSASAPVNAVISSSSVTSADPNIAKVTLFADLITVSCTPPKWGAHGGLKLHLMPLLAADFSILSRSSYLMSSLSSVSVPIKLVPLSESISSGSPLRLVIR